MQKKVVWCPEEDSNLHRLPSEGSASADWATGTANDPVEPAGGIKPPSHPYEGRVLSLNYAGAYSENGQMDGRSASHPKKGGSCTMPRPIFWTFTMSYSSILADRSSKFQAKLRHRAKLRRASRAYVRGSFDDADRAHADHARGTNAISASVVFLAINWAVLALLPVWRRGFGPAAG